MKNAGVEKGLGLGLGLGPRVRVRVDSRGGKFRSKLYGALNYTNCSNRESMAYTQGCEVGVPGVWVLAQSRSRGWTLPQRV